MLAVALDGCGVEVDTAGEVFALEAADDGDVGPLLAVEGDVARGVEAWRVPLEPLEMRRTPPTTAASSAALIAIARRRPGRRYQRKLGSAPGSTAVGCDSV